jgi:ribosome-associated translation inhibitor RaiA
LIDLLIFENPECTPQEIRIYANQGLAYKGPTPTPHSEKIMDLQIRSEGFRLTGPLHDFVQDRLRFALARFRDLKAQVHVRLSDDNGPRGGIDKRCQFEVRIPGLRPLLVTERDNDLYVAIGRGTHRIERSIARALSRRRATYA